MDSATQNSMFPTCLHLLLAYRRSYHNNRLFVLIILHDTTWIRENSFHIMFLSSNYTMDMMCVDMWWAHTLKTACFLCFLLLSMPCDTNGTRTDERSWRRSCNGHRFWRFDRQSMILGSYNTRHTYCDGLSYSEQHVPNLFTSPISLPSFVP